MNVLMAYLLGVFLLSLAAVAFLAFRNRVMLKMGVRPIPRRPGQTALIVIGVMLSSVIIAAAFGTGDTLSFSIRNEVIKSLKTIDEVLIPARKKTAEDSFGRAPYVPYERFEQLQVALADNGDIDGLAAQIGETVPALNLRTSLSEGRMRVAGIDGDLPLAFGTFNLTSGKEVSVQDLAPGEVYVNDKAAEELEAEVGDELRLFIEGGAVVYTVRGIVERGGLAGDHSTTLIPLDRAQKMFDRPGQINSIVVSNTGDELGGVEHSKDVAKELRVQFNDRDVASQLKVLLNQPAVIEAIKSQEGDVSETLLDDVAMLREELQRAELGEELISLLGDNEVVDVLRKALDEDDDLSEVSLEAATLFEDLAEFRVIEFKRRGLEEADQAGSFVTTFFVLFSLFSIAVGILLIFLIFVMLASARRSEMGMARAVGAKRRHLVQMFVFEGTAYSLASAAVGVGLGLLVSALMIGVLNRLFATFEEDFRLTVHFEARTILISYCLGMLITFTTVAVSAFRVSRLNIVAAVRGLPAPVVLSTTGWREILLGPVRAFPRPFRLFWRSGLAMATLHPNRALGHLARALLAIVGIPASIVKAIALLVARFFMQGWMPFIGGVLLAWWGVEGIGRDSAFTSGVSLTILGTGLMLRTGLRWTTMRPDRRDRVAFTFTGVVMLVFWSPLIPARLLNRLVGELEGDFEMMFVSGIFMVGAAVWTIMYNADLLLRGLAAVTGRIGKLRPVLVTAVAYPMSNKFRTGLTVAMFALVIFSLMVMSVLSETFGTQFEETKTMTGGWDIRGFVNANTPISDIRASIEAHPDLKLEDFQAVGGYTGAGLRVRQLEAEDPKWEGIGIRAVDDEYLDNTEHKLKLVAEGFGESGEDVWQALKRDSTLAVVGGFSLPTREGATNGNDGEPWLKDLYYDREDSWSPIDIRVREPETGVTVDLKIIAVVDRVHQRVPDLFVPKALLDGAVPFPVPITSYEFKVAAGVDSVKLAKSVEASFVEHGMEAEDWGEIFDREASGGRAFFRLFIGFMSLGLLVGVAGLGVVSTRAVVERRQQIGVLRAIGYRRRMIQLSFLFEASFISLMGILIGSVLGIVLGYQAFNDIKTEEAIETIKFNIPWIQIGLILAATYLFSLLATFLPARAASRTYPAEALRYE